MKRVHLRRVAKRDLWEAVAWYREKDPNLANRFLDEVYATIAMIEQFPLTGGAVFGAPDASVRQLPVNNFPYAVIFKRASDRTTVLAVAHNRKKPGYWNR